MPDGAGGIMVGGAERSAGGGPRGAMCPSAEDRTLDGAVGEYT